MSNSIHVAVAVIHYQHLFLLGYRNANQHQGNRYEFVGGKIEMYESPQQGLVREVAEEIGCDLSYNPMIKMGVIRHDYPEKSVALHIFNIEVTQAQFDNLQSAKGSEGQAITWVTKVDLLTKKYPLPEANARILDWLTLPNTIFISQSLDKFANEKEWLDFYASRLPQNAYFYSRPQTDNETAIKLIVDWQKLRHDIMPLMQYQTFLTLNSDLNKVIVHLNHQQLTTLDVESLPKSHHYFASCHDQNSLSKINELSKTHTVMGCFLSPVLPTPTHPESHGMGWQAFGDLAEFADVPVFALGGVGQVDLATAYEHGAMGVAGIRLLSERI